jgi:hypothetical protein
MKRPARLIRRRPKVRGIPEVRGCCDGRHGVGDSVALVPILHQPLGDVLYIPDPIRVTPVQPEGKETVPEWNRCPLKRRGRRHWTEEQPEVVPQPPNWHMREQATMNRDQSNQTDLSR